MVSRSANSMSCFIMKLKLWHPLCYFLTLHPLRFRSRNIVLPVENTLCPVQNVYKFPQNRKKLDSLAKPLAKFIVRWRFVPSLSREPRVESRFEISRELSYCLNPVSSDRASPKEEKLISLLFWHVVASRFNRGLSHLTYSRIHTASSIVAGADDGANVKQSHI